MNTDVLVSVEAERFKDKREGGEQRGRRFGDQSGDEQEEVLGGTTGVWQGQ